MRSAGSLNVEDSPDPIVPGRRPDRETVRETDRDEIQHEREVKKPFTMLDGRMESPLPQQDTTEDGQRFAGRRVPGALDACRS